MRFIQPNIILYFFLLILGISGFFFSLIWPHAVGFYMFIALAAVGGLGVSCYIYYIKKEHKQLVCPVGSNCNAVVNSRYAKFLGVSLEYWGMLYYAAIFVSYVGLMFSPHLFPEWYLVGLAILTAGAFFFSLYLLFVQAFLLRQWCIWCLLSASLSIVIFIISLGRLDAVMAFLVDITGMIEALNAFGFALGVGGVSSATFLFFRFLRDLHIDERELQTLKVVSEIVWLGLAMVLVGHFASYVSNTEALVSSGLFLAQSIALFVVTITSAVLMIILTPFLGAIPFDETVENYQESPLEALRKPLFITGSIVIASWYFAFGMDYVPEYGFSVMLLAYVAILFVATVVALFLERRISKVPESVERT